MTHKIPDSIIYPATELPTPDYIEPYATRSRSVLWLMTREGRRFILKGLPEELRTHPEEIARLRKEYSIGLRLPHPGIAATFGFETHPDTGAVIVLEYVDGQNLSQYVASHKKKHISEETRRQTALKIARALTYIHDKGFCHRDLKPDNILVTEANDIRIIDFGMADSSDSVIYKTSMGTKEYGAPEQQLPSKANASADIYSFGKILQLLLPERRYNTLAESCFNADPALRPDMGKVVAQLEKYEKKGVSRSWIGVAVCSLLAAIAISFYTFVDRRQVAPQEQKTITIVKKEDSTAVAHPSPAAPETSVVANTATGPIAAPEPKEITANPSADTPSLQHPDKDAIMRKYMEEADKKVEEIGPIPRNLDFLTYKPIMENRTNATKEIATRAEKELKEAGVIEPELSKMIETYWFHILMTENRVDGI